MNHLFASILLSFSALFSCQQSKVASLPVKEFDALIQDENVQRVDVRTVAEYSEGHIIHSVNINVLDPSFIAVADSVLRKDKPVALYCRSGKRSKKAAAILSERGYTVYELKDGFNAWKQAGKEEEK
ncbi:rhodanese-like domain-containing protein [uncultured Bacteroides sp.]|uniref:rhodanese-like domain-containing protein n=1 Tax=uncultured Bacteroides sp. TaxID=162156 RepID=UPI002AA6EA09|nr:rhodanese-like domain-containing protein [uncultured Bacteroides sp.]